MPQNYNIFGIRSLRWGGRWVHYVVGAWLLAGCFRSAIPITIETRYPVDVFYEGNHPPRPYTELQSLIFAEDVALTSRQKARDGRMLDRGNNQQQKEILLARLTLEAKKLGADALVNVRYRYYTTANANGYSLEGIAVKYAVEQEL